MTAYHLPLMHAEYPEGVRKAVLLVSGTGDRRRPVTKTLPNSLVGVGAVPSLTNMLSHLAGLGTTEIAIVVGHHKEAVIDRFGASHLGMSITYVVSEDYATTDNVYSLWLAEGHLTDDVMLLKADVVFERAVLARSRPQNGSSMVSVPQHQNWVSGTVVSVDRSLERSARLSTVAMLDDVMEDGSRPSALSFLFDGANLLTLAGLLCSSLSIYFSMRGAYVAASIALLWALFSDWFDGPLARRSSNRSAEEHAFGGQLDSLADLVSGGVAPAMLLLCIAGFEPWFLPGALLLIVAGALRLAHFNIFGHDRGAYRGLPIDMNIMTVTALLAFREPLGPAAFPWVLYGAIVMLAILNITPVRIPKLAGGWCYAVAAYVVGMTAFNVTLLPGVTG